jgi:hypothetical protein
MSRVETNQKKQQRLHRKDFCLFASAYGTEEEKNSWHELCTVQKETDSEVSRSRRLHGARRLATRGNGAPAALAKPQPQPPND